jgi:hypothetical protein
MRSQVPSARHRAKNPYTAFQEPVRQISPRRTGQDQVEHRVEDPAAGCFSGRPSWCDSTGGGGNPSSNAHCASVNDDG